MMPWPLDVLNILADVGQVPSDSEDDIIFDEDVNEAELDEDCVFRICNLYMLHCSKWMLLIIFNKVEKVVSGSNTL